MSKDQLQLSVPSDRHFMAAKATIPANNRNEVSVEVREGYNAVYYETRFGVRTTHRIAQTSDPEKLKSTVYTVYWIHAGDEFTVDVPWGLRVHDGSEDSFAVNGSISVTIHTSLEELLDTFPLSWQEEYRDGVKYEYLTDYFIDSTGVQQGLSIFFRNHYIPRFKQSIAKIKQISEKTIEEAITKTDLSFDHKQNGGNAPMIAASLTTIHITPLTSGGNSHAE